MLSLCTLWVPPYCDMLCLPQRSQRHFYRKHYGAIAVQKQLLAESASVALDNPSTVSRSGTANMNKESQTAAQQSIETLVKQHQTQLQSFLYRFTASKEDAEDLAQETFAKAYSKFDSFRGESSFKTWLFAIATNLAKDHLRSKHRWPRNAQDKCKETIGSTPALEAELKDIVATSKAGKYEIREHIDFCFTCIMKTLPIEQHLALMLADIYSFKIKEIAQIMGASIGVVKHYLHDARTTMQNIFEHRCALINKNGICHQCSELNGLRNKKAETQRIVSQLELVKASEQQDKSHLFSIRTTLIQAIDPLQAAGTDLHDFLLRQTARVANEEPDTATPYSV